MFVFQIFQSIPQSKSFSFRFVKAMDCGKNVATELKPNKSRKRKQTPNDEIPPEIASKYMRLENLLRHKAARQYLKYEFEYNDWENEYFHKTSTFEMLVDQNFPNLKTRNLTMAEWRMIRRKVSNGNYRRFSPKFIQRNRIELEKYRRRFEFFGANTGTAEYLSTALSTANSNTIVNIDPLNELFEHEIYRLIVDTNKLFAAKQVSIAELQRINDTKNDESTVDTTANPINIMLDLQRLDAAIGKNMERLWSYDTTKDALLLDAVAKGTILYPLSSKYFRLHCQVCAHTKLLQAADLQTFTEFEMVTELIKILLEMFSTVVDRDLLSIDVVIFFDETSDEYLNVFQVLLTKGNIEHIETVCLPKMFRLLKDADNKKIAIELIE